MRNAYFPFVIALVFLYVSCKNDSNPVATIPVAEIVPLKIGNSWTASQTNYDTLGNIVSSVEFTSSVTKDTTVLGKTFFFTASGDSRPWRMNTDTGLVHVKYPFYFSDPPSLYLDYKYPTSVGDFFRRDDLDGKVIATNVTVQVPAGTFSCIKYEFSYGLRLFEVYVQPGVGEVKTVSYFALNPYSRKDSVSSIIVLNSYHLN